MKALNNFSIEDKKLIVKNYRKLIRIANAKKILNDGDMKIIKKAFDIALNAHNTQRRISGEPYITHPIAVAQICIEEIGLGTTSIIAALLHDVVEDTEITLEYIERNFGDKVALIVDGLTKAEKSQELSSNLMQQNDDKYKKILVALSKDVRVILIKLADRLDNMRTLEYMTEEKQKRISSETLHIYAPLAHQLGLNNIKTELENLSLLYINTDAYKEIESKLYKYKSHREKLTKDFLAPIIQKLDEKNIKYEIKSRHKSIYSIYKKMQRQSIPFEDVFDLFAIRIILKDLEKSEEIVKCWEVYTLVKSLYTANPNRFRDWLTSPKENGYESLHTTVFGQGQWVEVQIRTQRMDEIAERGFAAHWEYKKQGHNNDSIFDNWLNRLREVLEHNHHNGQVIQMLDDFNQDIYRDRVYANTPKGRLIELPKGSTVLDFAFAIHTDIGLVCMAAKVNRVPVTINHVITNGDVVEIITSKKQIISKEWLDMVISAKAKSAIRHYFHIERKKIEDKGKEELIIKLSKFNTELDFTILRRLSKYLLFSNINDLLFAIGNKDIPIVELKKYIHYLINPEKNKGIKTKSSSHEDNKLTSNEVLIGKDEQKLKHYLAPCCSPVGKEEVFGYLTENNEIEIHAKTCKKATELFFHHSEKIVKARWSNRKDFNHNVNLRIDGIDRTNIIQDVFDVISKQLKINVSSVNIQANLGIFEGYINLQIKDFHVLKKLIKKIKQIDSINSVDRVFAK